MRAPYTFFRTDHSDTNFEGLESTIMDKSLGTNLHSWRFCAHIRREYNPSYYLEFPKSDFQHCIGGEGKSNPFLKGQSHELRMRDFLPLGALRQ